MKKILVFAIFICLLFTGKLVFAQGENELKNFRFGLFGQPAISWYKPDNIEKIESKGSKLTFAYGLMLEFRLSKVVCLSTGIGANYSGGKLGFKKDTLIYPFNDNNIDTFRLIKRDYKISYFEIPLTLKMKTPEIGAFTYFGQFGVNLDIKTKAKSLTDDGSQIKNNILTSEVSKNNVDITKDMNFLNIGLNIGGGMEYNLAGSTSLVFSVNYHNSFTNVLKATSDNIKTRTYNAATGKFDYGDYKQMAKLNYVSLTVGILF